MSKITGTFEYDLDTQQLSMEASDGIFAGHRLPPFCLDLGKSDLVVEISDDSTIQVDRCMLWFEFDGGKSKLSAVSCDIPKV